MPACFRLTQLALPWCFAIAALAWSPVAAADAATDKAAAEALFEEGKNLMEAGKFADGCKKLEASNRLDAGLGTLLYLADCYEKAGRSASAWATFREAASLARGRGDETRAGVAAERAERLEGKLSKLWLKVAEDNPPDLVVERDGSEVPRATWGVAIPVDAGTHQFRAHAPGKLDWEGSIDIAEDGMTATLHVPSLEDAPVTAAPAPTASTASTAGATLPPGPADRSGDDGSGQRVAGFVLGGVGVVGIVIGAIFGLDAIAQNDDSLEQCDPEDPTRCTALGKELRDSAATSATISTVGFGVGAAALAAGTVLVLTAPSASDSARLELRSKVGAGGGQLSLGGRF